MNKLKTQSYYSLVKKWGKLSCVDYLFDDGAWFYNGTFWYDSLMTNIDSLTMYNPQTSFRQFQMVSFTDADEMTADPK